jgi:Ca2+-binding RTX toxin-like protein
MAGATSSSVPYRVHVERRTGLKAKAGLAGVLMAVASLPFVMGAQAESGGPECFGRPATIIDFSDGGQTINGTSGDDVILAGEGADFIDGKGGSDRICAGPGWDVAQGGTKQDKIKGGPGRDDLSGRSTADSDHCCLNDGDDILLGNSGRDHFNGGSGDDDINGGKDNDIAFGGPGNDTCYKVEDKRDYCPEPGP